MNEFTFGGQIGHVCIEVTQRMEALSRPVLNQNEYTLEGRFQ